ncbi:hypothetical protein [Pedobacter sp.]|uniref:hypothetical protein n=1 Tax=Pedobacter sp. TaxID=1411316 RepID=UPI003C316752
MKKVILLTFFAGLIMLAKAQPGIGYLRSSDGLLYSVKNGFGFYELLGPKYPTSPAACPRVQLGTKTGVKYQFVALGTQHDENNYLLLTATGPVQCDLDHYVYGVLLLSGIFGFRILRKQINIKYH